MPELNIPPDCRELGRRPAAFDEVADYAAHDQNENEQRQKPRPPAVSCEQHINLRFWVRPINGAASNSSMYRAAGKRKLSRAPASSCLRAPRPTSTRRCHRRQHHPAFFLDRRRWIGVFSPCIRSVSRCVCRRRKWAGRPFHGVRPAGEASQDGTERPAHTQSSRAASFHAPSKVRDGAASGSPPRHRAAQERLELMIRPERSTCGHSWTRNPERRRPAADPLAGGRAIRVQQLGRG